MRLAPVLCALVVAVAPNAAAQKTPVSPGISLVGAAFDEGRGRVVIVGGYSAGAASAETWEWDGAAWTRVMAAGPSPRDEPRMVYDRARKRIVLFGGDRGREEPATDTWSWDGATWRRLAADGPPLRGAKMVYDARRDRIVLFGGANAAGVLRNETWEWDGATWTQVVKDSQPGSPPARALMGLAYDERRGRVVMMGGFGGFDPEKREPRMLDDTWEWDGVAWKQVNVSGPGARDHVELVYDASRGAVVLHGGGRMQSGAPSLVGDSWSYDGRAWIRLLDDGPRRGRHRLVYDPRSKSVLLYGGWGPGNVQTADLWRLSGRAWTRVSAP
jgi:hypothetical protein